ncbi:hypothetical protein CHS0354_016675 [Potamilus streckersoni]|uniref:C1q domain-containing protein n=1 Tax=Potamilus streckersoni TaxID=2493646 RepID=A0AAE0WEJ8_9BIVA|nr:hypothetical protein CHS0354_016675 [Potamilus streckersoni]
MLLLTFLLLIQSVLADFTAGERTVSQNGDDDIEMFEFMHMIHSELMEMKQEQYKMKSVQDELSTTKKELLKTQSEFSIMQKELKRRVHDLEDKNRHLEIHMQKLMTSCRVDNIPINRTFTEAMNLGHKRSDQNSVSDYLQGEKTGNVRKAIIRRSTSGKIGFTARLTNTMSSIGALRTIVFDDVYGNAGNGYDVSSGMFHAPVAGMYVILVTVANEDGDQTPDLEVVHNASPLCRTTSPPNTYGASPCNAIAHLNAGDAVWIRVSIHHPRDIIRGNYYSTFSVGLLSSDDESRPSS